MNARALKQRIRYRLWQRKFEIERLERAYWHTVNGNVSRGCISLLYWSPPTEQNLQSHVEASIKQREPTISRLANNYNDLCQQLSTLIKQGKAPQGSTPPQQIRKDGLFKLDVDDNIWQDVGLDDAHGDGILLWLGNEAVRVGIQALLECDCCDEEELRLRRERCNLQLWFTEKWECIKDTQVKFSKVQ